MKRKLQVEYNGQWLWVAEIDKKTGIIIMTTSKRKAMPEKTYWCVYNLDVARKYCPCHTFRVAASLED